MSTPANDGPAEKKKNGREFSKLLLLRMKTVLKQSDGSKRLSASAASKSVSSPPSPPTVPRMSTMFTSSVPPPPQPAVQSAISRSPQPPPRAWRKVSPPSMSMLLIRPQSTRIQDITPPKIIDESTLEKELTTYSAYTIRKAPPRDSKEGRGTWARAEHIEERWAQEDLVWKIRRLSESRRSVVDKKKSLAPYMEGQLTALVDNLASTERDGAFEWSLVQLDTVKKPVSISKGGETLWMYEPITMRAFVKRSPRKEFKPGTPPPPSRYNNESSSPALVVRQRGLKVLIKGHKDSAFGDTGAGQNVISDRRREELGLEMISNPTSFPMGNSKRIFSPGTVKIPIAFEDDPTNVMTIVAHVVHTFAYDLLLGNPFLKATNCLTKYVHRFVPCLFSFKSRWSLNLLGETTNRFHGRLGKGIDVFALPDIGSVRNVMNADWARKRAKAGGFEILSRRENCGWIVLPDGTEEATVGQARTTMTLPDGRIVPMVFELLPNCYVPVVLGQDFVFDQRIYTRYSGSIREFSHHDLGEELMPMGYRKSRSKKKRILQDGIALQEATETDDLERQLEWNLRYQNGRKASSEEWDQENSRREEYERRRDPNWQPGLLLIEYKPRGYDHRPSIPGSAFSNSSSNDYITPGDSVSPPPSSQTMVSNSTDSTPSHEDLVRDTGHSPSDSPPGENRTGGTWNRLYLGDFGRDEAAQWQEEHPI